MVQFEPIVTLQALSLAPLRVKWISDYPKLSETTPRPPRKEPDSQVEFISSDASWPMPNCALISSDGNRVVEIQNDRFGLTWSFDEDSPSYPGFVSLSGELAEKFGEFEDLVSETLRTDPKVTHVTLSYVNHLEGMDSRALSIALLSGGKLGEVSGAAGEVDYVAVRTHSCAGEANSNTSLFVGIDSVNSEQRDRGKASLLRLEAERATASSKVFADSLAIAHDVVLSKFLGLTTDEMRRAWGPTQ